MSVPVGNDKEIAGGGEEEEWKNEELTGKNGRGREEGRERAGVEATRSGKEEKEEEDEDETDQVLRGLTLCF